MTKTTLLTIAAVGLIAACAPRTAPAPIYAEPVFDKYGNPSCRPPDVPVGGVYTADLPLCPILRQPGTTTVYTNGATPGTQPQPPEPPVVPPPPPPEPVPPWQNQNQNTNQNTNTNQNSNQNQGG